MSSGNYRKKVVFSVTNCICNDQRVLKIAETVSRLDCDIMIIGRESGDCCSKSEIPFGTRRFNMIFSKGFLFYKFYNIRLLFHLLFNRYDILVANDLDTLLPNFIVSKLKRLPLVYDSHEYFTGVPEIQNRPVVKWVWKSIEKLVFPRLKHIMTVSDSIALQYERDYGILPITIRNFARKADNILPLTRKEIGVNNDDLLLILQGTGINVDRGGEELIDSLGAKENVSLMVVGSGDSLQTLKKKAMALKLMDRVKFIPKAPWEEMIRYTKAADAGVSLDKDTNINYRFSLPNKLFDYISAGIPVIVSDLPEIKKIVFENTCGIVIPAVNQTEIGKVVDLLKYNRQLLDELKLNAIKASETINWDCESVKIRELYSMILNSVRSEY